MPGAADIRLAQSQCPKYHEQRSSSLNGPAHACQRQMTTPQSCQHNSILGSLANSHRYFTTFTSQASPSRSIRSLSAQRTAGSGHSASLCTPRRRRIIRKRRRGHVCIAEAMRWQEACSILGVDDTCSREELRAAYLSRIKEVRYLFSA